MAFGVVCMCMIANMQYGWTFFVNPMQERHGWDRAAIQIAFTLFVVTETWLVPIERWFVDKYGPRIVTLFGGLLCGIAWVMKSYAESLTTLYIAAAIGGTGAGAAPSGVGRKAPERRAPVRFRTGAPSSSERAGRVPPPEGGSAFEAFEEC
ncbi:MFS family permease [Methylobacterium sp. BE186]|nr:MFS family permease [Methylobacterium sp. BE186]